MRGAFVTFSAWMVGFKGLEALEPSATFSNFITFLSKTLKKPIFAQADFYHFGAEILKDLSSIIVD